jgi:hypothetical protein
MSAESDHIIKFLTEGVELNEGTIVIYNGGEDPQVVNSDEQPKGKPNKKDGQQVTINGKRWHFEVTRNEHGQITGLDVEQL